MEARMTNRAMVAASTALSFLRIGRRRPTNPVANPAASASITRRPRGAGDRAGPDRDNPDIRKAVPDDDGDGNESEEGDVDGYRDELEGNKGEMRKAARHRERARIAAILSHPAAVANPGIAASLALSTDLDRAAACKVLAAVPAPSATGASLADRMARAAARRDAGRGTVAGGTRPSAASWDAAAVHAGIGRNTAADATTYPALQAQRRYDGRW